METSWRTGEDFSEQEVWKANKDSLVSEQG